MPNYHNPKPPTRLPRTLSPEETRLLLRTTDQSGDRYAIRDSAILHVLYSTGCRSAELCGMTTDRYDLAGSRILVTGKYRRERWVFLSNPARRALDIWIDIRARYAGPHAYIFVNIPSGAPLSDRVLRLIVAERGRAAFGPYFRVHPHMFRHSFATHLYDSGADITDVSRLMGHASLDSTMVYQHVAPHRLAAIHDHYLDAAHAEDAHT
jgi:site-specific recombinase XerD